MSRVSRPVRPVARSLFIVAVAAALPIAAAGAQGRGHNKIPPGQMPRAGYCRVWFDGLPPGHQPLATDCATAFRDAPPDARILVGDGVNANQYSRDDQGDHGQHRGWDKGHGNKHHGDDDQGEDNEGNRVVARPADDCLAYTADGECADVYAPAAVTVVLPDMVGAILVQDGRVWPEVGRWLGSLQVVVHVDAVIGGRPSRVRWTDRQGHVIQEWIDTDGDGRADVVRVYRRGRVVRTYGR